MQTMKLATRTFLLMVLANRVYSNSTLFARKGQNITLSCSSPTRAWRIWQNKTVVNGGFVINPDLPTSARLTAINNTATNSIDLHIRSVEEADETTYWCIFQENSVNVEWNIYFSLYVAPDSPTILNIQGGSYIEGTEGQPLGMTCQSYNGNPPADVTWKTGQTDLATSKNTVTYQFTPTRTNHLQMYTCVSNSPALSSPLQISVQLILNLRPQTPVVIASAVKEGENIVAHCVSTGSRPAAQLTWLLYGVIQTPTGQQQEIQDAATQTYNVSLQYRKASLRSDNTKNLVCRANNTALPGGISEQQQLIVWYGPDSATINGSTTLNENTEMSLTCYAALSNPQSTFTWYKNGSPITVSSPVSTQNGGNGGKTTHQTYSTTVRKGDNGANITCVATSTARSATAHAILNVRYRPTVQIQPSSTTAIVDSTNLVFTCVVTDSYPTPNSYRWTKGGSQISVNQSYTIQNVRRIDAGTYSCTASNIAGTSNQATTTLNVLYPPVIGSIPNQTPEEGTILNVTCTITESNPAPNRIYWTLSKDPTFRQNSSVIIIPNISRGYTDTYTCHAENTMAPSSGSTVVGSDQKQVIVDVLYGPGNSVRFDPVSSTISMEENNTRSIPTIRCLADCNPPCQYSWTGNTGSSTATLNLGTATRDKNGTYTCKASNIIAGNKRESQKELNVLIFYHARITSFEIQSGAIHDEHSDVSLICTIDSYPLSNVTWASTGDRPPSTQQSSPSSTLLLRNVTCPDTANYTCSAYNGYGSYSMETKTLYVRCTPRLPSTEKEREEVGVGDGENLTISSTFMAYPAPNVSWYFKATSTNTSKLIGQTLVQQIGLNMFNSTLVRVLKDEDDFGEYRSLAVNSAGSDTAHQIYIVAANRQPGIATNISVQCQTSTTANISWTRGFDGGLQQWFNIMYRPTTTDTYTSSSNISDTEKEHRYYIIFNLRPATQYFFKVKSTNSLGSVPSLKELNCKTEESEKEGGSSSAVIGGVAGTSAAILLIIIVIVVIFLFRRVQSKTQANGKDLSERPLATMNEVPDGIKDNILYESAGDNFNRPRQDVYAEVVKPKKKGAAVKTNDVYAEVQKPNKSNKKKLKGQENKIMMDVYENVGDIKGASKQQGGKSNNHKPAERGYRNEDGLLYVDVDIKPSTDGRRNVIIGDEERTDYASVDFVIPP